MKYLFIFKLRTTILSERYFKNSVKKGYLEIRNLCEEKNHPEQKHSVTFVAKVFKKPPLVKEQLQLKLPLEKNTLNSFNFSDIGSDRLKNGKVLCIRVSFRFFFSFFKDFFNAKSATTIN